MSSLDVRVATDADAEVVGHFLADRWGPTVVSRGRVHRPAALPTLVAELDGLFAGCLTYRYDGPEADGALEVVTIDAVAPRRGIGSALMKAVCAKARRVWLITTNDNVPAQSFYARLGMTLVAVHKGAVADSRRLKPSIPVLGLNGVPIEDELVYEWQADNATSPSL